jgi:hypothetical protein
MTKASKIAKAAAALAAKDLAPPRTELEVLSRELRHAAANEVEPLVNRFAAANGDYVGEGNRTKRNRGGTPIARWRADNLLSDTQALAIDYCIRLWERAGRQALTMDPTKVIGLPPSSGWSQQEALDELAWFKSWFPDPYFSVFENVCRFDEPAGVAGSRLSSNMRSAQEAAKTIVKFVADYIAMKKRF